MTRPEPRTIAVTLAIASVLVACGSRSQLLTPHGSGLDGDVRPSDGAIADRGPVSDATVDAPSARADGGSLANVCRDGTFTISTLPVSVVLVLDTSLSMGFRFDGTMVRPGDASPSRFTVLQAAIAYAGTHFDERVAVGAKLFPSHETRGVVTTPCSLHPRLDIPITSSVMAPIWEILSGVTPAGGSPIGPAVAEATAVLRMRVGARIIVIATDGAPTCGDDPEGDALIQIERAREVFGIDSFVVGIAGTELSFDSLDAMAIAGGRPRPTSERFRFFEAPDELQTIEVMQQVSLELTSCVFPVPGGQPGVELDVRIDGVPVPRDPAHTTGWDFSGRSRRQIGFFGPACAALERGRALVDATVTCPA